MVLESSGRGRMVAEEYQISVGDPYVAVSLRMCSSVCCLGSVKGLHFD